jgi:hypothetical protein
MIRAFGRTPLLAAMLALAAAAGAHGQDSQFGIRGLGTPGRPESVRARSAGGAFAPFDASSALVDAALGDQGRLAAWALMTTSWRRVEFPGANASLTTSRFPEVGVSGPIGHGITIGGGFTTYLDRSYHLATPDTLLIRGVPQAVVDHLSSDGGVADIRLAGAAQLGGRLSVGVGLHLLTGTTRVRADREFVDTTYSSAIEINDVAYDGFGVSASAIGLLTPSLHVAVFARSDGRLRARIGGREIARNDLPVTLGAGAGWEFGAGRLAATVSSRSWGDAGAYAHDVTAWSVGAELGRGIPLRLGARGGTLPFSPAGAAPKETGASLGTGFRLPDGRGLIDLGVERLERRGAGLTERVWTVMVGITVRP